MATYAVTFDLKYDTSESYGARYASFMEAIRKCSSVWTATTSFALVQTSEALEDFERRLYLTRFDVTKDQMVVIDVSYDSAISRGAIKEPQKLASLLPGIVQK
jgi:hypothetical protein